MRDPIKESSPRFDSIRAKREREFENSTYRLSRPKKKKSGGARSKGSKWEKERIESVPSIEGS